MTEPIWIKFLDFDGYFINQFGEIKSQQRTQTADTNLGFQRRKIKTVILKFSNKGRAGVRHPKNGERKFYSRKDIIAIWEKENARGN